jgi:molybdopterin-guanine dinucleotide biosynthesis protein A
MGRDKALVEIGGMTMIDRVAAALSDAGLDVIVAGPPRPDVDLPTVADTAGVGPLAGLLTGLRTRPGADVFLTAVDQPLLRPETVLALLATPGVAAAPFAGVAQVTCAVYRPELASAAGTAAAGAGSLRSLLDDVDATLVSETVWRTWGEDGRSWLSVDRPDDVALAEELLSGSGLRSDHE